MQPLELQRSLHFQLTKKALPTSLKEEAAVFAALEAAAVGRSVLLVVDDASDIA